MNRPRRPMGTDMTTEQGRAGLTARLRREEIGHMAESDGLGADPLPPKQASKLAAMRRWASIDSTERLADGRLKVTFSYLGLVQSTTWANE
jgi:hypothetical protein